MKYLVELPEDITPDSLNPFSVADRMTLVVAFKHSKVATETRIELAKGHTGMEAVVVDEVSRKPLEGFFNMYAVKANP